VIEEAPEEIQEATGMAGKTTGETGTVKTIEK
jgi:hypothetical protein